ncbi:TetR/AcrR family transcriptional regulator [Devosia sp. J2-20]|uniref:TetR family transcriptional regulator n=1 Tax=Devosia litorisediminis TaxID=2829817 RepID=A0A942EI53_9HYPH|nr:MULTISPECIES: TetR/AcrR family transcriptional regulator [Devosia]MBS3850471.1 TetR family transcriptional regulator [Devosia litorisediminis]MCZ4347854.1 TetR/AcrR family transcriptional regulator [Devosia neptuniae]WDR00221.1 TetR/AcrR family transcriptional regulator [Devosia sp. J2-20]
MSEPSSIAAKPTPPPKAKPPRAKRVRDSARTKAEILVAGRAEFAERGFEGARVDAIAALAGANKRLLYHYYGNKEELYRAVLLDAYQEIRRGERALSLDQFGPAEAMDRLVRFTFRHFLANPWFPRLLNTENIENARFLKTMTDIQALHSPLVGQITTIVERGAEIGVFRRDVDPVQLYISIAALGFFYVSNMATLSVIFARDLSGIDMVQEREAQAVQMVLDYLRTKPVGQG